MLRALTAPYTGKGRTHALPTAWLPFWSAAFAIPQVLLLDSFESVFHGAGSYFVAQSHMADKDSGHVVAAVDCYFMCQVGSCPVVDRMRIGFFPALSQPLKPGIANRVALGMGGKLGINRNCNLGSGTYER